MSQIKVILLASLLLLPLPALAQTQVPHTFTDGTPALASEVNENFDALADGVNAQDVRIEELEDEGEGKEPVHTFTYTKNDQEAGYEFQVGGVDVRLVDFPIYEFSTGDRYVVRIPILNNGDTSWTTTHPNEIADNPREYDLDIDGYSVQVYFTEIRGYKISVQQTISTTGGSCRVTIRILETVFGTQDALYSKFITEDISPQDNFANSYVDSIPAPSERDPDLARTACDDLIDYIQIFGPSQTRNTPP